VFRAAVRHLSLARGRRERRLATLALALILFALWPVPTASATNVSGTISSNTTWTLANSPYVMTGNVTVNAGVTLTIQPGVVVKLNSTSRQLIVNGALHAVGTAGSHIVFTSYQDDTAGGDTNGDGGATAGAPGQWFQINIKGSGSELKYADVRYGGWGTGDTAYGAVYVSNGAQDFVIEDSTLTDNQRSALRVGGAGVTVKRTTLERNAIGVAVNMGWVKAEDGTLVRDNSHYGLWFNYVYTYSGTPSSIMDSEISGNDGNGIYIGADQTLPTQYWPHGNRNNIYDNTGDQLGTRYTKRDVDWTMNYWGDGVDYAFNPTVCYGVGQDSRGKLAYVSSGSNPPAGPISAFYYLAGPQNQTKCAYDEFAIGPSQFYRTKIEGTPVPPGQVLGNCRDGLHATRPTVCGSDPVNTATGAFTHETTDARLPGIGLPFAFTRTYNSQDTTSGPFGLGWSHSYNAGLAIAANGDVTLHGEDGQLVEYTKQPDGSYLGVAGAFSTLTKTGSEYDLVRKDQVAYHFDANGRLTSMRDRNDAGLDFDYDGSGRLETITDSAGREITLAYNASSLISSLSLPGSREVDYGYTNGRLTSVTDLRGQVWSYTYDATYGWLATEVDPNQHTVFQNTYSKWGRVTDQYDALDKHTTFAWDEATQTATVTDARGHDWQDVYSGYKLVKRIDPLGDTWEYGYDGDFNRTSVKDPRLNTTTMTYDSRGNLLTRTPPSPFTFDEQYTYDAQNNVLTAQNGRGYTTSYGYDSAGNLTSITRPGSIVTTIGRDAGTGLITSITDPRQKTTDFEYDADGNLNAIETPLGKRTTMTYDASGRMSSRVDPRGNVTGADPDDYRTSFAYDDGDNLLTVTDPLGDVTELAYDDAGNLSTLTDANLHTTEYQYDAADRLKKVIAPDTSIVTEYGYDNVGNLATRTDPNLHVTTYGYDDANRLTSVDLPGSRTWTYAYDENGNRAEVTDANGNATTGDSTDGITTFAYDELNRLTGIDYSDSTPDVAFTYDANGNRLTMDDGAGTQSHAYDALDRLTSVTRGSDVFSYDYDDAGNVTSRTYPGGREVDYTYTDDGELDTVTSAGETTSYGYDDAGNLEATTLPSGNGYVETRSYDRAGRLTGVENANGGTPLSFADYDLDPVGNPETITTDEGTQTYTYDALDRLTEVCYQASCPGGSDPFIRWTYDAVGNRLTEERPAGTTTYDYNAADELTQADGPGGTTSYAFDENGNETQAGSRTFAYDLANRLASTTLSSTTTSYAYDGDGVRLEADDGTTTTNYFWDVNNALPELALERDGSGGALRTHVRGTRMISMDTGSATSYFHYDGLGSVANITSDAGDPERTYSYEPFGPARTETQDDPGPPDNVLRFAGELEDDTSLYHLRARQYDASTGRFLSRDPLEARLDEPCSSTYVYAKNRPGALIDPSGMGSVWSGGSCDWADNHRFDRVTQAFWSAVLGVDESLGGVAVVGVGGTVAVVCPAETGGVLAGLCITEGGAIAVGGGALWWESQHAWDKFWEAVYGDC
jgi:RHS repeat-associated protein